MTVERSRKGLVVNTSPGHKKIVVRQSDPGELPQVLADLNRSASAPETRQRIANSMRLLEQFAKALEEAAEDKKPAYRDARLPKADEADAVLDPKSAAERVCKQLARVSVYLTRIERGFAEGRAPSIEAIYMLLDAALVLPVLTGQLYIIDNENAIAHSAASTAPLKTHQAKVSRRAVQDHRSWQKMADEIWKRDRNLKILRVAEEVAATLRAKNPAVTVKVNRIRQVIKRPR
jgi:hypothetical protein